MKLILQWFFPPMTIMCLGIACFFQAMPKSPAKGVSILLGTAGTLSFLGWLLF